MTNKQHVSTPRSGVVSESRRPILAAGLFTLVVGILLAPIGFVVADAVADVSAIDATAVVPDTASDAVAATAAEFRVDESGSATYSVALYAVPGTAGVSPKLSLNYSSQAGNGPLGKGWSIGGLSSVSRCRATREAGDFIVAGAVTDGDPRPVNFTASDRYCLDGQRLLVVADGPACANVAGMQVQQLRTEVETFSRVCAYTPTASATNGPAFFTVERKDGSTSWYGDRVSNNTQSLGYNGYFNSTAPGKTALALLWAQTRFQDSTGNYIDYHYLKNPAGAGLGEHLISKVRYTGKVVLPGQVGAAKAPYAEIVFNYSARPGAQWQRGYQAGGEVAQTHRLDSIASSGDGEPARFYKLAYATSTSGSNASLLTSLQECRDSGAVVCMAPTTFDWSTPSNEFVGEGTWNPGLFGSMQKFNGYKLGDINGDGRPDMVWLKNADTSEACTTEYIVVAIGELDSYGKPTFRPVTDQQLCAPTEISVLGDASWQLFDYNGDGRDDLFMAGGGANDTWAIYPSLGESGTVIDMGTNLLAGISIPVKRPTSPTDRVAHPQLADLSGDGLLDIVYRRMDGNSGVVARLMERGTGIFAWGAERSIVLPAHPAGNQCGGMPPEAECTSSNFIELNQNIGGFQLQDFNGDSRSDLTANLVATQSYTYTESGTCTGGGGNPRQVFTITPLGKCIAESAVGYLLSLVVESIAPGSTGAIVLSTYGLTPSRNASDIFRNRDANEHFADFNGDGLTDLLQVALPGTNSTLHLNTGVGYAAPIAFGIPSKKQFIRIADLNGDGRADLIYPRVTQDMYVVRYATRAGGFEGEVPVAGGGATTDCGDDPCFNRYSSFFADLDADGVLDYYRIRWSDDDPHFYVARSTTRNRPRDVIAAFTNGFGALTEVHYATLTNGALYRRGANSRNAFNWGRGAPVMDLLAPTYAVASVSSSSPQAGNANAKATVHYRYAGAMVQGGGRGFLGFGEIATVDVNQSGGYVTTTTSYNQNFPYTGMPARTTKRAVVGGSYAVPACLNPAQPVGNACFATPGQAFPVLPGSWFSDSLQSWESDTDIGAGATAFSTTVQAPVQVRTSGSEESLRDHLSGTQASRLVTTFDYASYGNVTLTSADTFAGTGSTPMSTVITFNVYSADNTTVWRLGRLTGATVTHRRPGLPDVVRKSLFTYDMGTAMTGQLTHERSFAGDGSDARQNLLKVYTLDEYGNRTRSSACADPASSNACAGMVFHPATATQVNRYSRVEYDTRGRYPVTTFEPFWNGTGSSEQATQTVVSRNVFGDVTEAVNLNGVSTVAVAGTFGRPYYGWAQVRSGFAVGDPAAGVEAWTTYRWCGAGVGQVSCPAGARFRQQVRGEASVTTWTWFDVLGRPVMKAGGTFNVNVADKDVSAVCTDYNAAGNPVRVSNPFFLAGTGGSNGPTVAADVCQTGRQWTVTTFDVLGRPTKITAPDSSTVSTEYRANLTIGTDPRGKTTTEIRNAKGELSQTIDADGLVTGYKYNADGTLFEVNRDAGRGLIRNRFGYDELGRKTVQDDPDAGALYFEYNALGELTAQRDGEGNRIESEIDARGRTWRRTVKGAGGTVESTSTFEFDTAANGVGQLAREEVAGTYAAWAGQAATALEFARSYQYDAFGRGLGTTTIIDGVSYATAVRYDTYGRPWKGMDASGRWAKTILNSRGQAVSVCESNASDTTVSCPPDDTTYLTTLETDAWGNVIKERRGNGAAMEVTRSYRADNGRVETVCAGAAGSCNVLQEGYGWDAAGNLHTQQKDQHYLESFTYDNLNRLTDAKFTMQAGAPVNVTTLSHSYDAVGNVCKRHGASYGYEGMAGCGTGTLVGSGGAGPVGAHRVSEIVNSAGVVTSSYYYDARGNQTLRDSSGTSADRTIRYSLDDRAHEIALGNGLRARFWYGSDGARYKREDAAGSKRTLYLGNVEIEVVGGVTTIKRTVAGVMLQKIVGAAVTRSYLFHDHLGSLARITDANGVVTDKLDYRPFGERRDTANPVLMTTAAPSLTTRGFTGHEHIDGLGVIHMNGRIYDPDLGRFLQPDPVIQAPNNAQSWNAYTYVFNNPLRYTDPTGMIGIAERQWAATAFAIVYTYFTWDLQGGAAIAAAAAGGFVSGAIATGSWDGGIRGAFTAGLTAGIGMGVARYGGAVRVGAMAMTGGVLEYVQGGSFGHAFVAAGLTAAVMPGVRGITNDFARITVGALVGGTLSELTGGKFANGAISGAIQAAMIGRRSNEVAKRSAGRSGETSRMCPGDGGVDAAQLARAKRVAQDLNAETLVNNFEHGALFYDPIEGTTGDLQSGEIDTWGSHVEIGPSGTVPSGYRKVGDIHSHPPTGVDLFANQADVDAQRGLRLGESFRVRYGFSGGDMDGYRRDGVNGWMVPAGTGKVLYFPILNNSQNCHYEFSY
ncbi:FG-GAP-like repeat-containing protein [Montanilutibacter psychrotolerans]|uniref:Uncharacterized protein n=1 Tax=Montanilutibacter psychrotolerans TaxID=1327343 RepID=A0A3M8SUS6_9GAMM|nr:FG-GAP-like repeat-containing protein [Lysobacter psychrotolerans]RNF85077.1 hypothetical protein EER27_04635 [Lysobacter psychrotolerans]